MSRINKGDIKPLVVQSFPFYSGTYFFSVLFHISSKTPSKELVNFVGAHAVACFTLLCN